MADETSPRGNPGLRRGVRSWLGAAGDALVSVIFPAGCRICDALLTDARRVPICDACLASFSQVPRPLCEICGRPLPGLTPQEQQMARCPVCRDKTYAFERARSFAIYEGPLVRAILLLKFEQIEPLGKWFAERLAEVIDGEGKAMAADVVVPVPLHRERERERGYNQAALLSKPLARRLRIPHESILLMRTRARPDKRILSLEERWESVRGAFATRPGSQVDNLRVLLVDDVLTTGATMDACSRALLEAGAKSVMGLTVARAVKNPLPSSVEW
ncbi:MAG TPA: ComF family protein [Candidatus Angelobacter sp.]|nr:ComF family protein [Candidatus Angelobacter sp.]